MATVTDQQENIRFVQFIENYPCLYDNECKGYTNKLKTEKIWQHVANEFKLTVKESKDKWKNIRTVLRRHVFAKPRSGTGVVSKKEYYLSDALQYLVPNLRGIKKVHSRKLGKSKRTRSVAHDDGDHEDSDTAMVGKSRESLDAEFDDPLDELADTDETFHNNNTNNTAHLLKNQICKSEHKPNDVLDEDMTTFFLDATATTDVASKGNAVENSTLQSDELYLLSLKDDMKEMNSSQKRKFKRGIYELIDNILAEES